MKKLTLFNLVLWTGLILYGRGTDRTLEVHYFEQAPFAFQQNGKIAGIEIEIVQAFVTWAKQKKQTDIQLTYKGYSQFDEFYGSVKNGAANVIGVGTVSINEDRKKDVLFTPPYMNNISLLISDGRVETLSRLDEIQTKFGKMTGITTKGSVHSIYMDKLRESYLPGLKIEVVDDPATIPVKISSDPSYFGYIDLITFWSFVKKSDHFIKIHRVGNIDHEKLGFILPLNSEYSGLFSEFFESGFGFTATRQYQQILEKYLAHEVLTSVEID